MPIYLDVSLHGFVVRYPSFKAFVQVRPIELRTTRETTVTQDTQDTHTISHTIDTSKSIQLRSINSTSTPTKTSIQPEQASSPPPDS